MVTATVSSAPTTQTNTSKQQTAPKQYVGRCMSHNTTVAHGTRPQIAPGNPKTLTDLSPKPRLHSPGRLAVVSALLIAYLLTYKVWGQPKHPTDKWLGIFHRQAGVGWKAAKHKACVVKAHAAKGPKSRQWTGPKTPQQPCKLVGALQTLSRAVAWVLSPHQPIQEGCTQTAVVMQDAGSLLACRDAGRRPISLVNYHRRCCLPA